MQKTAKELKREHELKVKRKYRSKKNSRNRKFFFVENVLVRGIYFLYKDNEVVYIGKSDDNVMRRVCEHFQGASKDFDSFAIIPYPVSPAQLNNIETRLIMKYQPRYNIMKKKDYIDALDRKM